MDTTTSSARRRVVLLGAAGRDFHTFNVAYRHRPEIEVVAFTATQIPYIDDRVYPPELAGPLYPDGIPILPETALEEVILTHGVDDVVLAYSDLSHAEVMHIASDVLAEGASFVLPGPSETMLMADVPVVAVCAVRTGVGKSPTSRRVAALAREAGKTPVIIRHPMPYGDLLAARVQRFATVEDLDRAHATVEEREEAEPHIEAGSVVFQGVDYADVLQAAQQEGDLVIWDGGNNDLPFIQPDVHLVLVDPLRPGHETSYYPGEANLRMADAVLVTKVDSASADQLRLILATLAMVNPDAQVLQAGLPPVLADPSLVAGKRVLVVEDGPTLTHGGMAFGAGYVAAQRAGAAAIVDPRPTAVGSLAEVFSRWPVEDVLPAMGYSPQQLKELEASIRATDCDAVVLGTPADLRRLITIDQPAVRVTYDLDERGDVTLADVLAPVLFG